MRNNMLQKGLRLTGESRAMAEEQMLLESHDAARPQLILPESECVGRTGTQTALCCWFCSFISPEG